MNEGITEQNDELSKEADLLCGDAINNFKTVQSFGHEEELVKKYYEMMFPMFKAN